MAKNVNTKGSETSGTIKFTVGDMCSQHNSVKKVVGGTVSLTTGTATLSTTNITGNPNITGVDVNATYKCNGRADSQTLRLQYNNGNTSAYADKSYTCPCLYNTRILGKEDEFIWDYNGSGSNTSSDWIASSYSNVADANCTTTYNLTATSSNTTMLPNNKISVDHQGSGKYNITISAPNNNGDQSLRYATVTPVTIIESGDVGHIVCYQYGKPYVEWATNPSDLTWSTQTGTAGSSQSPGGSANVKQAQRNGIETLRAASISLGDIKGTNASHFTKSTTGNNITAASSSSAGTFEATVDILASDPNNQADSITKTVNLKHVVSEPDVTYYLAVSTNSVSISGSVGNEASTTGPTITCYYESGGTKTGVVPTITKTSGDTAITLTANSSVASSFVSGVASTAKGSAKSSEGTSSASFELSATNFPQKPTVDVDYGVTIGTYKGDVVVTADFGGMEITQLTVNINASGSIPPNFSDSISFSSPVGAIGGSDSSSVSLTPGAGVSISVSATPYNAGSATITKILYHVDTYKCSGGGSGTLNGSSSNISGSLGNFVPTANNWEIVISLSGGSY